MSPDASVSVVIPAFRAEATLPRAVESACVPECLEIVIVSDDGTDYAVVLAKAGLRDPRVRHASTGAVGAGPARARNQGHGLAQGRLIAWLDADDVFLPGRLARLAPLADAHGAAADNVRVVDDATGALLQTLFPEGTGERALGAAAFLDTAVPIMPVVRRTLDVHWDEDRAVLLGDDVAYNLRLIDRLGALVVTGEALHEYRVRAGSVCHAPDSAALAEASYEVMRARLKADGFGFRDQGVRAAFAAALEAKIALNRAFAAAQARGEAATFQDFIAKRAAP